MDNDTMRTKKRALINAGEENEMEIFGFRTVKWKLAFCIIGYILSLGILLLVFYWKPEWDVYCNCVSCDLEKADVVLLRTTDNFKRYCRKEIFWIQPFIGNYQKMLETIVDERSLFKKALMKPDNKVRCIQVQKIRYVWNPNTSNFQKIGLLDDEYSCSDIHTHFGSGFSPEEQEIRKQVCGLNIIEVEVTPIWKLLFKEVFNPFYIFQAFSLSLWFATGYIEYAAVLSGVALLSIGATVWNLRKQSVKLHKMVTSHNNTMVTVLRKNGVTEEINSWNLVPGDVIVLTGKEFCLPCDAILLTGSCVVNEGMLTGESVPVMKTPLPNVDNSVPWMEHSAEDYKRHILFCGTEVIQVQRGYKGFVKAVVIKTGFNIAKGDLVRSILYPKPVNFKLHRDAMRFLIGLLGVAVVFIIYTAVVMTKNNRNTGDIVVWCLLIIATCIPPSLPSGLTLNILYAQTRLQKSGIFCLSPQRINMCGQLNIICFDKTGTLTEDGMELWGVVPSGEALFQDVHIFTSGSYLHWGPLLGAMVSCHSLIVLDGKVQGDPLDVKMFEETGWFIQESKAEVIQDEEPNLHVIIKPGPAVKKVSVDGIVILHQFPFSSSLQRMSVIAQVIGGDNEQLVFMKGAPEMVVQFCKQETVPPSFQKELKLYALQGFRVIALANKTIEGNHDVLQSMEREDVESDLDFLGLLILENKLKPETKPVLQELMAAKIRTVMITGDNLQTACTVGKSSGLVARCSNLITLEAKAPSEDCPASITWETVKDTQQHNEKHEDSIDMCEPQGNAKPFHFAMTGKTYEIILKHFYTLLPKILLNGTIFARMSPGQKASLIEEIQKMDYYAGMCGDGANDCGVLHDSNDDEIQDGEPNSCVIIKPGPAVEKVSVDGVVILHQFPFSSSLQRMSVIAQVKGGDNEQLVFMKGAPEMVVQFCKQETVPQSFQKELTFYTSQGLRVIALAYRTIEVNEKVLQSLEREIVESDLEFLGLLILENKLKPETKPVLQELMAAKIRTVMITGDNLQTACTVGKSSGLVSYCSKLIILEAKAPSEDCAASITWESVKDSQEHNAKHEESIEMCEPEGNARPFHFAMTGKSYDIILKHFYTLLPKILLNGTIFARMSPGQKASLIEEFQKIDYYAGMCGDGANDCGALKVAHAGISLSELEASVASPFTSKKPDVECVPKLIKEGRNTLVTSFCIFKYITMYAMIELICLMLLFWTKMLLGNRHYLMQDVAITIPAILTMSLTGPAPKLAPFRPSGQLISPPLLLSMVLQLIFTLVAQTVAYIMVQRQPWYDHTDVLSACLPFNHTAQNNTLSEDELVSTNYCTTSLWFVSGVNIIIVEVVFSKGKPFRKPIYTNYIFSLFIIAQIAAYFFIFFADFESLYNIMQEGFIENRWLWLLLKKWSKYQSKSQYRVLERLVRKDPTWPPVNETIYSDQSDCKALIESHGFHNPAFEDDQTHRNSNDKRNFKV